MRTLLRHARLSRFLRSASLAAAPLMLAGTAQAAAVFDAGGLRIDAAQQSQRDVNTGQSQTFRITAASFQGEALCGPGGRSDATCIRITPGSPRAPITA